MAFQNQKKLKNPFQEIPRYDMKLNTIPCATQFICSWTCLVSSAELLHSANRSFLLLLTSYLIYCSWLTVWCRMFFENMVKKFHAFMKPESSSTFSEKSAIRSSSESIQFSQHLHKLQNPFYCLHIYICMTNEVASGSIACNIWRQSKSKSKCVCYKWSAHDMVMSHAYWVLSRGEGATLILLLSIHMSKLYKQTK
jgi:hypothetical protein